MSWTAPEDVVARTLGRHRRRRVGGWVLGSIGMLTVLWAHVGVGHGASDWSRFQQKAVQITGVVDGQTLRFATPAGSQDTLRLLGVAVPLGTEFGAAAATAYLQTHAQGRQVTLLLDWPQTRDPAGRLMAYVFPSDQDLLNADEVRDGAAYAERRTSCLLQEPIDTAERTARKAQRGIWQDSQRDQTPLWRRQWFATRPTP